MGKYRIFKDPNIPTWKFWAYKYTVDYDKWYIVAVTITMSGAKRAIEKYKLEELKKIERSKEPRYYDGELRYEESS